MGTSVGTENQPAQFPAQAEFVCRRLAFLDSFNGALVSTGTAGDTDVSVDDVLVFAFGNSLAGALVSTSAALDASIGDNVSHDITSICVV